VSEAASPVTGANTAPPSFLHRPIRGLERQTDHAPCVGHFNGPRLPSAASASSPPQPHTAHGLALHTYPGVIASSTSRRTIPSGTVLTTTRRPHHRPIQRPMIGSHSQRKLGFCGRTGSPQSASTGARDRCPSTATEFRVTCHTSPHLVRLANHSAAETESATRTFPSEVILKHSGSIHTPQNPPTRGATSDELRWRHGVEAKPEGIGERVVSILPAPYTRIPRSRLWRLVNCVPRIALNPPLLTPETQ
jgi:hypothetical protein